MFRKAQDLAPLHGAHRQVPAYRRRPAPAAARRRGRLRLSPSCREHCLPAPLEGYESGAELAAELVQGWKDSPEHRDNMLSPAATETGVGIAQGEQGALLRRPDVWDGRKSAAIRFSVENRSGERVQYSAGGTLAPRVTRTHTVCRRPELSIDAPAAKEKYTTRPADGARYTVTTSGVR